MPDGQYTNLADAAWLSPADVVAVGTRTDERDNNDPLVEEWRRTEAVAAYLRELYRPANAVIACGWHH